MVDDRVDGSGAPSGAPSRTRDGIVSGTPGDDRIDMAYAGDPDGDRIDNLDAILPGTRENDDVVDAGDGNDTVMAGLGNDTVFGGAGNDVIHGGADDDRLFGGDGDDTLFGGDGQDILFGGAGNDRLWGEAGDDTLKGGEGQDLLVGGAGNDWINGQEGNDTLFGGEGDDRIFGEDGDDTAYGGAGDDSIEGGAGNDVLFGGAGSDTIFGGTGDDVIGGDAGDDVLFGGDGDDVIFGGAGNDTIHGGSGRNILSGGDDRDLFLGGSGGSAVDGGSGGDDFDTLDLRGSGVRRIEYTSDDREDGIVHFRDGTTMTFTEIENVIPCFTPGTVIATPHGERPVEELKVGDRIITRDNGIQEIRWIGRKDLSARALVAAPHLRPILIRAGALGHGLPERDMLVSPNHRILVANERTQLYFEESEVLAAAKHMVGSPGIHAVDVMGVSYIHFMFDQHEVVLSNGAWTESFQPGDWSLKGIGNAQRSELFELFPELRTAQGIHSYHAARKTLKKHEARLLVRQG